MLPAQRSVILSHAVVSVAAAITAVALTTKSPSAQAVAGGAPYASPEYCSALPALVARLETTVLPQQARDLAAQEARLREAESGRNEAEQDFNSALRDGIIKLGTDQIASARVLRERVQAMSRSGMNAEARRIWLEKIKSVEDFGERLKSGGAAADYAGLVQKNQANLQSFMQFVDDSGAADIALKGLADMVAPGVGGMVVGAIKVGLDVTYAGLKGRFTERDVLQWRQNVDQLRAANRDLADRVVRYRDDLTSGLCGPRVAQQTQNSPRPIPPAEAVAPPPPPAAPVVSSPPPSGPSLAKILGWTAVLGGGAVAGAYLYEQSQLLAEETAALSNSPAPTQTSGASPFNGNYRATVTRSCVAGPFPAVCAQVVENSSCSPTNFTFTVTNGSIRDCGPFFNSATVQSNGSYSGRYQGSGANGVPVTGTFQTSGTFLLQGTTTDQGSSYMVRIQVTKQ